MLKLDFFAVNLFAVDFAVAFAVAFLVGTRLSISPTLLLGGLGEPFGGLAQAVEDLSIGSGPSLASVMLPPQ